MKLNTPFLLVIAALTGATFIAGCSGKKGASNSSNKIVADKVFRDSIYNQTPLVLWYTQPALQRDTTPYANGATTHVHGNPDNRGWDEALPIGNGRLAGMVFGGIKRERLQLNEESLWSGKKIENWKGDASKDVEEIRKLIFEGKESEAQILAEQKLTGLPQNISYYQSLVDVFIDFPEITNENEVSHYYRDLHIDSAIATVHYEHKGKQFTREVFASYPAGVIVMRLTCNWPNSINAVVSLQREAESETFRSPFDSTLLIQRGTLSDNGLQFETQLKAVYSGGSVQNETRKLVCRNVDTLTLYISAATSFKHENHALFAKQLLLNAIAKPYQTLKNEHIADYKSLFDKVTFNLTSADKAYDLPTDKRIEKVKSGQNDKYLTELMFQYGRYLLISSSRYGTLPANMQGKWNEHLKPLYGSGYKIEWTLPLVYSAADVTNLQDCEEPLHTLVDLAMESGTQAANDMYKLPGWTAHDFLSIYGNNYPTSHRLEAIPPMGAAWIVTSLYESYLYTGDKAWLRDRLFPKMKYACEFMLNYLVEIPQGKPQAGKLAVCPSLSEENEFEKPDGTKAKISYASAMDQQLVYELFTNTLHAIDELSTKKVKFDPQFRLKLSAAIGKLAIVGLDEKGEMQEWMESYNTTRLAKNYISQLYGLYPGSQINRINFPKLAEAAQKTLENELPVLNKSSHGKPLAAIWWARLGKPDHALKALNAHISESTAPNLLASNPPFFIDGNMLYTSAVAEMLLQSTDGIMEFLPAEPATLGAGYVKGLCAKGGFECSIFWENNLISAKIVSKTANDCTIKTDSEPTIVCQGKPVQFNHLGNNIYKFATEQGKEYAVSYKGGIKTPSSKGKDALGLGIDLGIRL